MDVFDKGLFTVLTCSAIFCLISIPLILRKVPRNPIYGYRTQTTLNNDKIWYDANAYFAWRFFLASVLAACIALLLDEWRGIPPDAYMKVSILLLAAPVVIAWLPTVRFIRNYKSFG
ncbi:MAG: SdpI family protein [Syntrophaceae bacterium]|nr:SdpI family protein [Syntrophaceae bacterium]